ncbi:MAG: GNAT family N-acetyltransferase [Betaproteobacteria bacterium HGW-Betaproteobacteria-1]|jgi:GNAT superfamily N-acetyltransferase|nr:MAG: GNAT family N-acetyltransferase [Betaproteobacteria bacterium HGW-Betaproteobacteria-1]
MKQVLKQALKIEQAEAADIPALAQLLSELFAIEQDFDCDHEKQIRGLGLLLNDTERAAVLVARDAENRVVGMVTAQLVISTAEGAYSAWIEDMVVTSSYRGSGIGRSLLEQVTAWAKSKGASRAQLLVDLDNQPAIDYYRHLSWQATSLAARRLMLPG